MVAGSDKTKKHSSAHSQVNINSRQKTQDQEKCHTFICFHFQHQIKKSWDLLLVLLQKFLSFLKDQEKFILGEKLWLMGFDKHFFQCLKHHS